MSRETADEALLLTTLCFPVVGKPISSILLGYKKQGFGAGKVTGFGGKVEQGETPTEATIRELAEETGLVTGSDDLFAVGVLVFRFPHRPAWSQKVHLFVTRAWSGELVESDEMRPAWFAADEIPYVQMWEDGRHWLPRLLAGHSVEATFVFETDNQTIASSKIRGVSAEDWSCQLA